MSKAEPQGSPVVTAGTVHLPHTLHLAREEIGGQNLGARLNSFEK